MGDELLSYSLAAVHDAQMRCALLVSVMAAVRERPSRARTHSAANFVNFREGAAA